MKTSKQYELDMNYSLSSYEFVECMIATLHANCATAYELRMKTWPYMKPIPYECNVLI